MCRGAELTSRCNWERKIVGGTHSWLWCWKRRSWRVTQTVALAFQDGSRDVPPRYTTRRCVDETRQSFFASNFFWGGALQFFFSTNCRDVFRVCLQHRFIKKKKTARCDRLSEQPRVAEGTGGIISDTSQTEEKIKTLEHESRSAVMCPSPAETRPTSVA